jgi:hypothetical protein
VRLKQSINETAHAILVKQIKQELDAKHEPTSKFSRKVVITLICLCLK